MLGVIIERQIDFIMRRILETHCHVSEYIMKFSRVLNANTIAALHICFPVKKTIKKTKENLSSCERGFWPCFCYSFEDGGSWEEKKNKCQSLFHVGSRFFKRLIFFVLDSGHMTLRKNVICVDILWW